MPETFTAVMRKGEKMDDLIEKLSNLRCQFNCFDESERYAYHTLSEAIKVLSERPKQRWIPCSERLPDKPNMYTVTDSKGDVVRFVFYDNDSSRKYWRRCAKAWMPLPEPYRAERREEG